MYLSDALQTTRSPSPLAFVTHCMNTYPCTYSHREGGEGGTLKRNDKKISSYKDIQKGAVAMSYITNGFLIYDKIFAHFLMLYEAHPHI